ncbi:ATPase [Burkholderia ubonensis]|uniref:ATPase n=1 Tax=Burkholderia ubonensis TaxID=101571 RepID=A0A118HTV3_9BURK|nr:ATPase [Burkholderia ubonensis]
MRRRATLLVMAATVLAPRILLAAGRTPSPPGAEAYIIWPSDGATITGGKFWVRMGLRNMGICPKGIERPNVGHHHLLIDADLPPLDQPIPSDRNHLHYGAGQTEARIELPPGKHTLQLLMGDHDHVPHDPPVYSKKITITVK